MTTTGSPWDEYADLPDHDYWDIYGAEAAWHHYRARLTALQRSSAQHAAEGAALLQRPVLPTWPPLPGSPENYTYAVWWSPAAQRFRACVAEFPTLIAEASSLQAALAALLDTVRQHLHHRAAAGQPLPPARAASAGTRTSGHS
jgi:hypothetical protein